MPGSGSVFSAILASGLPDDETHILWRGEHTFAILKPGRHEITLRDKVSGLSAKTFVIVQEE